ncbi:hypothetical protein NA57DRAFT_72795 [Rhizodiscina lignyota]|uniref:MYND-type domain-containing protein n=1 Tax=Rhizodiscina lignyota TaxID=1504668 RepID=A0A9P4MBG1_9PEZI|nr:hypothetical protein NA57DRAFT_72795 [Rhizodiscina lignyota]
MSAGGPWELGDVPPMPPLEAASNQFCCVCDNPAAHRCGQCKSGHYCSTACQVNDWPTHAILCKDFLRLERPEGNFQRALFFPQREPLPRFIWIPYSFRVADGEDGYPRGFKELSTDLKAVRELLGLTSMDSGDFGHIPGTHRELHPSIYFFCKNIDKDDGYFYYNQSIATSTNDGATITQVLGDRVVLLLQSMWARLKEEPTEETIERLSDPRNVDITMDDFRTVINFFRTNESRVPIS